MDTVHKGRRKSLLLKHSGYAPDSSFRSELHLIEFSADCEAEFLVRVYLKRRNPSWKFSCVVFGFC